HPQAAPQRHRRALRARDRGSVRQRRVGRIRDPHHLRNRRHRRAETPAGPAQRGLRQIMDIYFLLELAVNGVLIGLMYTLVALGIVLIFKSSGIANLAQGALAMAGAYIAWALLTLAGVPLWIAVPLSLIAMFFIGAGIERVALRPMIGQPVIMVIMLTLGLEILLRGLVPAIFGSVVKRLDLGIPQAPVIIGPMLINTAYLVSGG